MDPQAGALSLRKGLACWGARESLLSCLRLRSPVCPARQAEDRAEGCLPLTLSQSSQDC